MKAPARPSRTAGVFFAIAAAIALATATATVSRGEGPARAPARAVPGERWLSEALARAHAQDLAHQRMWQVLLHYRSTLGGGWKSEADGLGFFFAGRRGKTDPGAELDATLSALFRADPRLPDLEQPQCRFPVRTAWLRDQLGLDARKLAPVRCTIFDFWRTSIAAEAATLVYATAYLNSPASMYGHTFLRLSRATGEGNPLLDYVVNFAADVDTKNGFVYAVKGLTGGFRGLFYLMPYYFKVQEYSNMESRDLWEYALSLNRPQLDRLVGHVWETRSTHFDYFFFSENCSYQLLTLLEVADPELHLVDAFAGSVIPSDTVRVVLAHEGLVKGLAPRPALLTTMKRRRASLTPRQVELAERWAKLPGAAPPVSLAGEAPSAQALILDTAYDYMRFREGLQKEPSAEFKQRERKMLIARGETGEPSVDLAAAPSVGAPEWGHDTLRLAVGGGFANQSGPFQRLSLRPALHDFLDRAPGYPDDSELAMAELTLRLDDRPRRFGIERFDAVHIVSALPYDRWIQGLSWRVWIGADNAWELGCARVDRNADGWRCLYGGATTGGGVAARWGSRGRLLSYLMGGTDVGVGPAFSSGHDYRLGAGADAGLVAEISPSWRWEVRGRYFYYPLGARGGYLRAGVTESFALGRRLSFRVGVSLAGDYAEVGAQLGGYL